MIPPCENSGFSTFTFAGVSRVKQCSRDQIPSALTPLQHLPLHCIHLASHHPHQLASSSRKGDVGPPSLSPLPAWSQHGPWLQASLDTRVPTSAQNSLCALRRVASSVFHSENVRSLLGCMTSEVIFKPVLGISEKILGYRLAFRDSCARATLTIAIMVGRGAICEALERALHCSPYSMGVISLILRDRVTPILYSGRLRRSVTCPKLHQAWCTLDWESELLTILPRPIKNLLSEPPGQAASLSAELHTSCLAPQGAACLPVNRFDFLPHGPSWPGLHLLQAEAERGPGV